MFRWAWHSFQLRTIDGFKITWSTENITRWFYSDNWRPWNWNWMRIGKWETSSWGTYQHAQAHTHTLVHANKFDFRMNYVICELREHTHAQHTDECTTDVYIDIPFEFYKPDDEWTKMYFTFAYTWATYHIRVTWSNVQQTHSHSTVRWFCDNIVIALQKSIIFSSSIFQKFKMFDKIRNPYRYRWIDNTFCKFSFSILFSFILWWMSVRWRKKIPSPHAIDFIFPYQIRQSCRMFSMKTLSWFVFFHFHLFFVHSFVETLYISISSYQMYVCVHFLCVCVYV